MSHNYGMRVDVGHEIKPGLILRSICQYGCMRTDGFCCPYGPRETRPWDLSMDVYMPVYNCPSDVKRTITGIICYTTQTTERYIQDHHTISLNGKEVRIMDLGMIKEARRTPDGNCVAVDDIVDVKVNYINNCVTRKLLNNASTFTARISGFEDTTVIFDLSEKYKASSVDLYYTDIVSMHIHTEVT